MVNAKIIFIFIFVARNFIHINNKDGSATDLKILQWLQLVADFYIEILCSRFCNWLQPGLQPPELQLPSCRAIFSCVVADSCRQLRQLQIVAAVADSCNSCRQ
jgi:hypothetical protein